MMLLHESRRAARMKERLDHAKVMTFKSLYRLEKRGLLDCPVVGVAADDWSLDRLREHARDCITGTGEMIDPDVFARLAARLAYVGGDFTDSTTYVEGKVTAMAKYIATAASVALPPPCRTSRPTSAARLSSAATAAKAAPRIKVPSPARLGALPAGLRMLS